MRYRVLCIGRRAKDPLVEVSETYLARLSRYVQCELVRLREGDPKSEREQFARRLWGRGVSPRDAGRVVALCENGSQLTTAQLAKRIQGWQRAPQNLVTFLIGGASGLHPDLRARASESLALSKLTLPHRLALVLLLEQLYRAHTILRGEPYHRA